MDCKKTASKELLCCLFLLFIKLLPFSFKLILFALLCVEGLGHEKPCFSLSAIPLMDSAGAEHWRRLEAWRGKNVLLSRSPGRFLVAFLLLLSHIRNVLNQRSYKLFGVPRNKRVSVGHFQHLQQQFRCFSSDQKWQPRLSFSLSLEMWNSTGLLALVSEFQ